MSLDSMTMSISMVRLSRHRNDTEHRMFSESKRTSYVSDVDWS